MTVRFDNTYARELHDCCVPWSPAKWPQAREIWFNPALARELGLDDDDLPEARRAALLSGHQILEGAQPVAQAYAGHQFGRFSPQLGDGRALLLGELIDPHGGRHDLALKGSGRTPFSRGGDGKAAVGPMLREVIISEYLHAVGVPTTRALAVVATGEAVMREQVLPGAVLVRVASSHLRVGTFEYFAARQEHDRLRRLVDYAIARHDATLLGRQDRAIEFLKAVVSRQARLVAQWMNLGFIHGVMNTDNMAVSGQSIDFGPCAFMEAFDPAAVFSSIDHHGRYAWGNQPAIAQWNLARLAETLLPLIDEDADKAIEQASAAVGAFVVEYARALLQGQRLKMGLASEGHSAEQDEADRLLADDWLTLLHGSAADFTRAWWALGEAAAGDESALEREVRDGPRLQAWLARWRARARQEMAAASGDPATALALQRQRMQRANPVVIPRNHRVEEVLQAASDDGDLQPLQGLLDALRRPFDRSLAASPHAQAAPPEVAACHRTFCGT